MEKVGRGHQVEGKGNPQRHPHSDYPSPPGLEGPSSSTNSAISIHQQSLCRTEHGHNRDEGALSTESRKRRRLRQTWTPPTEGHSTEALKGPTFVFTKTNLHSLQPIPQMCGDGGESSHHALPQPVLLLSLNAPQCSPVLPRAQTLAS